MHSPAAVTHAALLFEVMFKIIDLRLCESPCSSPRTPLRFQATAADRVRAAASGRDWQCHNELRRTLMRTLTILKWLFAVLGAAMLIGAAVAAVHTRSFLAQASRAQGTVVALQPRH